MKIFTNQNFYIDYYIIYTNIQKKFYKLHFYIKLLVFFAELSLILRHNKA